MSGTDGEPSRGSIGSVVPNTFACPWKVVTSSAGIISKVSNAGCNSRTELNCEPVLWSDRAMKSRPWVTAASAVR